MESIKSDILENIFNKAKKNIKTIVLPESNDKRILEASFMAIEEQIADIILVGKENQIKKIAQENNISIDGAKILDPDNYPQIDDLADGLYQKRKKKGMTENEAFEAVKDPLYFADMLVSKKKADGCVAGAANSTGKVVKAAIHCIGSKSGTVSSFFLMLIPNFKETEDYTPFIFADCAVIPSPTSQQLADIAHASSESCHKVIGDKPRIAMLSFSTLGSAKHESVDKVVSGVNIVRENYPELDVEGEIQFDAAVVPSIGKKKASGSKIAGNANVLIFPDLNAGNICYKAVERFGKALAIGPFLQGLNMPANDLSRGCSADDVFKVIAFTSVYSS